MRTLLDSTVHLYGVLGRDLNIMLLHSLFISSAIWLFLCLLLFSIYRLLFIIYSCGQLNTVFINYLCLHSCLFLEACMSFLLCTMATQQERSVVMRKQQLQLLYRGVFTKSVSSELLNTVEESLSFLTEASRKEVFI